jgi:enoyl-CoA hydratase
MSDDILYEVKDGGVAWITFNRPQARNAMTFGMYDRLGDICREIDSERSVRVLVLCGAGDKAFVAGTDITQFRGFSTPGHALEYEARMDRVFDALETVRVPTIAAIQGACTGGGMGLAAACDLRLATPTAKFGFPIARTLGNTLSMRTHARMAALLGVARTKEMIFLARLSGADEMRATGFLNEIVADGGLYARAEELARRLLEHAPLTLDATKQALNTYLRHVQPRCGEELAVRNYTSEDFREGMESFLGKRKPQWKGR